MFGLKRHSLGKCRTLLQGCYQWYKRNWENLPKRELEELESKMESLDAAIRAGNKKEANQIVKELEKYGEGKIKKPFFHWGKELVFALGIALVLATIVRQTWFELYEIPSGSMRPTYKEQDHLVVSKTTFGINTPFMNGHLYFNPDSLVRGNPVIWSGNNIDLPNTDTKYFWIFPYKKRYIKRLIGKPGDTLYFYGGKIFGIDSQGNDISRLLDNPYMKNLDYIPFTTYEGKEVSIKPDHSGIAKETTFLHFNEPFGKISINWLGNAEGKVPAQNGWEGENAIKYQDFLGMKNFAMARLLTQKQLDFIHPSLALDFQKAPLYLELTHNPALAGSKVYTTPSNSYSQVVLNTETSIIPLTSGKLDALMNALYTARFEVRNGKVRNYSDSNAPYGSLNPELANIENGTYEFYNGKAYKIGYKGWREELPKDNPLYSRSPENVQKLFNLGIHFNEVFSPRMSDQPYKPFRYAYFRNGDLYIMGHPVFKKGDTALQDFLKNEERKENASASYTAFKDYGPPIKDGKIDAELVKKFGIHVPENHYLVLGDNHAMSGDSRSFGFVPEANIKGTPSFIFWPPGSRWGFPNQASYPSITVQNVIVWCVFIISMLIWYRLHRWKLKQPVYKKLSKNPNALKQE